jgi:hypothetical protein
LNFNDTGYAVPEPGGLFEVQAGSRLFHFLFQAAQQGFNIPFQKLSNPIHHSSIFFYRYQSGAGSQAFFHIPV